MGSAVKMRTDFSAAELRRLAKASKEANQSRRLLSLAAIRDGRSREEAAKIGGTALSAASAMPAFFRPDGCRYL